MAPLFRLPLLVLSSFFHSFLRYSPCSLMADTVFSTAWTRMLQEVCKSSVSLFLGGIYFLLGTAAFYVFSRRDTAGRLIFMWAIGAMLCLAMSELVMQVIATSVSLRILYSAAQTPEMTPSFLEQQASLSYLYNVMVFVEDLMLVGNNLIADGLFAYRCYLIWGPGYNKQIIILPLLLLLVTTALGGTSAYFNNLRYGGANVVDTRIGFAFAISTNLSLTGLTAGRIWWTRRELRIVGKDTYTKRYSMAISVLLESGIVYCIFLTLVLVALSYGRHATSGPTATFASLSYGAAGQMVNIVPTVFIVRIGLFPPSESESEKSRKFLV
ncbi:hypothetical protein MSAN_01791000 [Mycena sanguinolenta]|uniref:Uncharacterized protein n=1 Tax=Mycena sanguinolenta TaxID=230812 RepID=A0A8H7CSA9_9AGAR|nr:hypothetical protein MSAN_01791000 [Mycena sanguinolenta]